MEIRRELTHLTGQLGIGTTGDHKAAGLIHPQRSEPEMLAVD